MRAPAFWWGRPGIAATVLAPAAAFYGALAARRLRRRGVRAGIPVVCVGNPTLGGAGKTPAALKIAAILSAAGRSPAFLSRGYGGALAGPVQVDPARHDASAVGDEPLLLARSAPTIVARDRAAGAQAARAAGADIIVMDDGFQNPTLEKDLALLVVDARRGVGNGRVFPAGPLRAPLAAQLARAHGLLIVGDGSGAAEALGTGSGRALPVFRARLVPDPQAVAALAGRRYLAFAGIGDPEKFFTTLAQAGIEAPVCRAFPDHHPYSAAEADAIQREAERHGLEPITTEKDWVRLGRDGKAAALRERARTLPVTLRLDDEEDFRRFVLESVAAISC